MELFVLIIAVFVIVIAVVSMFSKGKSSSAMENLNYRIKTNTAEVIHDFNQKVKESGMDKAEFTTAKELLDSI